MSMGDKPAPPRCTLARIMAEPMDVDSIKRQGWREHQILVIAANDPRLNMIEGEMVKQLGKKLYGKGER